MNGCNLNLKIIHLFCLLIKLGLLFVRWFCWLTLESAIIFCIIVLMFILFSIGSCYRHQIFRKWDEWACQSEAETTSADRYSITICNEFCRHLIRILLQQKWFFGWISSESFPAYNRSAGTKCCFRRWSQTSLRASRQSPDFREWGVLGKNKLSHSNETYVSWMKSFIVLSA